MFSLAGVNKGLDQSKRMKLIQDMRFTLVFFTSKQKNMINVILERDSAL